MSDGPRRKAKCKNCGEEIIYSTDGLHLEDNGWYHNQETNRTIACLASFAEPEGLPLDPQPWMSNTLTRFVSKDTAVGAMVVFWPRPGYEPDRSMYA